MDYDTLKKAVDAFDHRMEPIDVMPFATRSGGGDPQRLPRDEMDRKLTDLVQRSCARIAVKVAYRINDPTHSRQYLTVVIQSDAHGQPRVVAAQT
jgi:hypothetical protein